MNKHGHTWTQEEDQLLLSLIAKHHNPKARRHTWEKITPHFQRTERSISQRYYHLKKNPKQMKLDMEPIKMPLRKRSITRKSFLWGLYTVEREG
jgi:oligoendopeptidase F